MDIGAIISKMAVLVIIIGIGYILGKTNVIDKHANSVISKITIDIAASGSVFASVLGGGLAEIGSNGLVFLFVVIGCNVLYFIVTMVVTPLLRAPKDDEGVYRFMMMFANCGFMGYPVARAVFGESSVIYVTYFVAAFNLTAYSIGAAMLKKGQGKMNWGFLLSPIMIVTASSFILYFAGFKAPAFLLDTANTLGGFMTPMAMLVIGVSLSSIPLGELFSEWRIFPATFVKIVLLPVLVWLILRNIITDPLMLGVATVISGMPIASSATMLALQYGKDDRLAAKTTFLTTILTAVTVPLIAYFLL